MSERDSVYIWADGVHFNIRLEEDRLCTLVIMGVRPDGTWELMLPRVCRELGRSAPGTEPARHAGTRTRHG
ncbi:MAG: hypothetical protein H0X65_19615 [Gemmatimonadetes bacterium]|nr:hypothetical protein [Gemmatimonadota bacterium]